jgi:hypothetical protein
LGGLTGDVPKQEEAGVDMDVNEKQDSEGANTEAMLASEAESGQFCVDEDRE